ncbi:MAG: GatC [Berkelbacteria bacterium GW2011_GWA1_36_9]|uniref:GatC n=1 Tax=Berkelbacteria bacterium GW2011_GWA1_36_9 TaxID=1618331 RepID=A0A0G0FWQ2_9BACT|nr:MAG: GatC [Berkelbacteria bacterium GW2011_GWA1_36_9]
MDNIAKLARLNLNEMEKEQSDKELEKILNYVAECEKAPTSDTLAISQISNLKNVAREDEPTPSLTVEKVIQNAPESARWRKNNFIKTKQVFES